MTNDIKAIADGLSELLPCPFCGSTETEWTMLAGLKFAAETCANPDCAARGPVVAFEMKREPIDQTVASARVAWNTRTITTLEAENASLREALTIGEKFCNACFSAWSCGEPEHRVRTMLDRADEFREALEAIASRALSTQGTTDKDSPDGDA